jgi:hypothetical protein
VPAASRHRGPRLVPDICERSAQFRPTWSPPLGVIPGAGERVAEGPVPLTGMPAGARIGLASQSAR